MDHFPVSVDEKECRVTRHGIGLHELFAGRAFGVYFEIDEKGIIEISQFFLREYGFRHVFTGTAPFGVNVHEDRFVFCLGFCQDFLPRARFEFYTLCMAYHASDKYTYK